MKSAKSQSTFAAAIIGLLILGGSPARAEDPAKDIRGRYEKCVRGFEYVNRRAVSEAVKLQCACITGVRAFGLVRSWNYTLGTDIAKRLVVVYSPVRGKQ
jgi:hypothetical protein